MTRAKTYILGLGTFISALTVGYFMQFGLSLPGPQPMGTPSKVNVSRITDTSSAGIARMPSGFLQPTLPDRALVAAADDTMTSSDLPHTADDRTTGSKCNVSMTAAPRAGAMVSIALTAPCQGNERVTLHHNGLMFSEVTAADGTLKMDVPALTQKALFIASFDNGEGAAAVADVTSLGFYDRVVLQWKGETGLQLHAREFDAPYGSTGHIWNASTGDMAKTALGESGFLIQLGNANSLEALVAEVYSFPVGSTISSGSIAMSMRIEAEITLANCGKEVEAQSLELFAGENLQVHDITLAIPECDSVGDFLVLKKPLQDLTIASN